ncbi:hypothetical protein [Micromonospora sp. NPDC093277]|uniref:hypothetical protein n=1 Tax=Micromonospora sp. NPDC093277 TaxID=3364291 RepID=UPI00380049C6
MVQVTVTAALKVAGGPTLPLSSTLQPQSYTFASVALNATGGAGDEQSVDLLPDGGTVVLLGVAAHTPGGKAAAVTLTPVNGTTEGEPFGIDGTLLIATPGVLAALVDGGPRSLKFANAGTESVIVEVLTGLEPS